MSNLQELQRKLLKGGFFEEEDKNLSTYVPHNVSTKCCGACGARWYGELLNSIPVRFLNRRPVMVRVPKETQFSRAIGWICHRCFTRMEETGVEHFVRHIIHPPDEEGEN